MVDTPKATIAKEDNIYEGLINGCDHFLGLL
jgi:hypothetical protein